MILTLSQQQPTKLLMSMLTLMLTLTQTPA